MTIHSDALRPIVVGVDGSAPALHAVRWAAAESVRRRVPLRLVHAQAPPADTGSRAAAGEFPRESGERWLAEAADLARHTAPAVEPDLRIGHVEPSTGLLEESRTARLVVVGARGRGGFPGLRLGSTALALATSGHCPVVVVRERPPEAGPVAVGVTASPLSALAVGHAFDQASARAETVIAVHAWRPLRGDVELAAAMGMDWAELEAEQDQMLTGWLAGWRSRYPGVRVTRMIATDGAVRRLLTYGRIAQLIVVGCRGRSPITGLVLGSAPRALLHHASCPVLVVRAEPR